MFVGPGLLGCSRRCPRPANLGPCWAPGQSSDTPTSPRPRGPAGVMHAVDISHVPAVTSPFSDDSFCFSSAHTWPQALSYPVSGSGLDAPPKSELPHPLGDICWGIVVTHRPHFLSEWKLQGTSPGCLSGLTPQACLCVQIGAPCCCLGLSPHPTKPEAVNLSQEATRSFLTA